MITVILRSLYTFFAIYGVVQLFSAVLDSVSMHVRKKNEFMIVIRVKDSENTIEGTIRMLAWKFLKNSTCGYIPDILIVDNNSTDNTAEIAQRLCDEYSFIYYTTAELYEKAKGK